MTFRPRMQAQCHSYRTLRPLSVRSWPGVIADLWHVHGAAGGEGFYVSPDPRLVVLPEGAPSGLEMRTKETATPISGISAFYIPSGQPLWCDLKRDQTYSHITFHLQAGPLAQRLSGKVGRSALSQTIMVGRETATETSVALAKVAGGEIEDPKRPSMMIDGLLDGLLSEVFDLKPERLTDAKGLSARQISILTDHVHRNLEKKMSVCEIAEVCGLSESWFSRAFRQSMGETPGRWMTQQRLRAALRLMTTTACSLAEIAGAVGFADQAHLTRVFQAVYGMPPSKWRRKASEEK